MYANGMCPTAADGTKSSCPEGEEEIFDVISLIKETGSAFTAFVALSLNLVLPEEDAKERGSLIVDDEETGNGQVAVEHAGKEAQGSSVPVRESRSSTDEVK